MTGILVHSVPTPKARSHHVTLPLLLKVAFGSLSRKLRYIENETFYFEALGAFCQVIIFDCSDLYSGREYTFCWQMTNRA